MEHEAIKFSSSSSSSAPREKLDENPITAFWDNSSVKIPPGATPYEMANKLKQGLEYNKLYGHLTIEFYYSGNNIWTSEQVNNLDKSIIIKPIHLGQTDNNVDLAIVKHLQTWKDDNPVATNIMFMTKKASLAPTLHKLKISNHRALLVCPRPVEPLLAYAANYMWTWEDIAHGKLKCTLNSDEFIEANGNRDGG